MTVTITPAAPAVEADLYDCGHLHTDGGVQACSMNSDVECIDCLENHIRTCRGCQA